MTLGTREAARYEQSDLLDHTYKKFNFHSMKEHRCWISYVAFQKWMRVIKEATVPRVYHSKHCEKRCCRVNGQATLFKEVYPHYKRDSSRELCPLFSCVESEAIRVYDDN